MLIILSQISPSSTCKQTMGQYEPNLILVCCQQFLSRPPSACYPTSIDGGEMRSRLPALSRWQRLRATCESSPLTDCSRWNFLWRITSWLGMSLSCKGYFYFTCIATLWGLLSQISYWCVASNLFRVLLLHVTLRLECLECLYLVKDIFISHVLLR